MNKNIQMTVEQLHDTDQFSAELAKATNRKIATIQTHWLKKDGYQIPAKFQMEALRLAFRLKKKQDKELNDINVTL